MTAPLDVEKLVAWLRAPECGSCRGVADQIAAGTFTLPALPCGHPAACVRGETTKYCGWCADKEAKRD